MALIAEEKRDLILVLSLLVLSIILISCVEIQKEFVRPQPGAEQAGQQGAPQPATATTAGVPEPAAASSAEATTPSTAPSPEPSATAAAGGPCTANADCAEGTLCIDDSCATIASLYNTACAKKCTVEMVGVTTSDGEKYSLARGQGSYTAAGALEWKVGSIPLYCPGSPDEKKLIPFHFIKKTTGKVLEEQVVTVEEGKTSPVITHPTVSRVKFTVRVEKVKEVC